MSLLSPIVDEKEKLDRRERSLLKYKLPLQTEIGCCCASPDNHVGRVKTYFVRVNVSSTTVPKKPSKTDHNEGGRL
eukprot:117025-Pelagomonas_calceolata.AAC.1